jgi:hypothetical protein
MMSACASETIEPRTQLILVADTDIPELARVQFDATQGGRSAKPTIGRITASTPSYVSLEPANGDDDAQVTVTATGLDAAGNELVVRRARVAFVPDQTKVVPLHLLRACQPIYTTCEADQTCTEQAACVPDELSPSALRDWTGQAPTIEDTMGGSGGDDGGATSQGSQMDGGGDGGGTSGSDGGNAGNAGDAGQDAAVDAGPPRCDGMIVDTDTDPLHCGQCDRVCPAGPHGTPSCKAGKCGFDCETHYADCKTSGTGSEGCESDLTSDLTCGSCNKRCNGALTCSMGDCVVP